MVSIITHIVQTAALLLMPWISVIEMTCSTLRLINQLVKGSCARDRLSLPSAVSKDCTALVHASASPPISAVHAAGSCRLLGWVVGEAARKTLHGAGDLVANACLATGCWSSSGASSSSTPCPLGSRCRSSMGLAGSTASSKSSHQTWFGSCCMSCMGPSRSAGSTGGASGCASAAEHCEE
jgi:hypothetical protein